MKWSGILLVVMLCCSFSTCDRLRKRLLHYVRLESVSAKKTDPLVARDLEKNMRTWNEHHASLSRMLIQSPPSSTTARFKIQYAWPKGAGSEPQQGGSTSRFFSVG
jgi:hypothetical protein